MPVRKYPDFKLGFLLLGVDNRLPNTAKHVKCYTFWVCKIAKTSKSVFKEFHLIAKRSSDIDPKS